MGHNKSKTSVSEGNSEDIELIAGSNQAILNFCTLFDSNYLSRGLVLLDSLQKYSKAFHCYVLAFDDICFDILQKIDLDHVTVIPLAEFENKDLLQVKPLRSRSEYCWTCTPSLISFCLDKFGLSMCTYVDADVVFFADPAVLIDEMGSNSILITEHRFTAEYDRTETSGKYCVQFIAFRNDEKGRKVLNWWREACLDACELNPEKGLCGDQKYLDDWVTRFEGVHELQHVGGGVAPWNVQQYRFRKRNGAIWLKEVVTGMRWPLIFYHAEKIKLFHDGSVCLSDYKLPRSAKDEIYRPYLRSLTRMEAIVSKINPTVDPSLRSEKDVNSRFFILQWVKACAGRILQKNNKYDAKKFIGDLW